MKTTPITFRATDVLLLAIDATAKATKQTRGDVVKACVEAHLAPREFKKLPKAVRPAPPAVSHPFNKAPRAVTKAPPRARALAALPSAVRGLVKPAAALSKPDGCPVHGKGCGFSKGGGLWWCDEQGRAVTV